MKFKFYALKLVLVCFVVFALQVFIPGITEKFLLDKSSLSEVWRFLTAIFLHGSLTHLLFNCFALALFGSILESIIGGKKFLLVFFATGIFANVISFNFYNSSLGASGAIYGILGTLVVIRPFMMVWAFGFPMPMLLAGILWALGGVFGLFFPSDTGHIAHLSGMFLGIILGFLFRNHFIEFQKKEKLVLNEDEMRRWEDDYFRHY